VDADTGQLQAIRDQMAGQRAQVDQLGAGVADLTRTMAEILELVTPVLRDALARGRDHNARSAAIRHTGRHRHPRLPPRCGDWQ
jgi:hypothetical protein